jgi:hypothetical protein
MRNTRPFRKIKFVIPNGRVLRLAAQPISYMNGGPRSAAEAEPVRAFSFVGLFNGTPDVAERSEEILREEFAKRADADGDTGPLAA